VVNATYRDRFGSGGPVAVGDRGPRFTRSLSIGWTTAPMTSSPLPIAKGGTMTPTYTDSISSLDLFWSAPSGQERTRPSDPLGLDAIREELSGKLVPYLTGRTRRPEDFLWTLAILRWSQDERSDSARVARALQWERRLKLWWCKTGFEDFAGVRGARAQCAEDGAPRSDGRSLLRDQRAQGLIGAHLRPLESLGLVEADRLRLTSDGEDLVQGVGGAPVLRDGDWETWNAGFSIAERGIGRTSVRRLQQHIHEAMPILYRALNAVRWRRTPAWDLVAPKLGETAPFAQFASRFLPWAVETKLTFDRLLEGKVPKHRRHGCQAPLGITKWSELAKPYVSRLAKREPIERVMAEWHRHVYQKRSYGDGDLLAVWEEGHFVVRPVAASYLSERDPGEGDCRWRNAVAVMRPR
jgi:hypothetical protein